MSNNVTEYKIREIYSPQTRQTKTALGISSLTLILFASFGDTNTMPTIPLVDFELEARWLFLVVLLLTLYFLMSFFVSARAEKNEITAPHFDKIFEDFDGILARYRENIEKAILELEKNQHLNEEEVMRLNLHIQEYFNYPSPNGPSDRPRSPDLPVEISDMLFDQLTSYSTSISRYYFLHSTLISTKNMLKGAEPTLQIARDSIKSNVLKSTDFRRVFWDYWLPILFGAFSIMTSFCIFFLRYNSFVSTEIGLSITPCVLYSSLDNKPMFPLY